MNRDNGVLKIDESKPKGKWKLVPNFGRLVLEMKKRSEVSAGGIIIPEAFQARTALGIVKYLPERSVEDLGDEEIPDDYPVTEQYKIGDYVVIGQFVGTAVEIGRETLLIIRTSDVLAKLVMEDDEEPEVSVGDRVAPEDM